MDARETQPVGQPDPPRTPPTDTEEELARLRADAAARGLDPDAAVEVARTLEHTLPAANALRAVDRRIATGLSVEEARRVLVDEETTPPEEPHGPRDAAH